jgi:hypothetical protein
MEHIIYLNHIFIGQKPWERKKNKERERTPQVKSNSIPPLVLSQIRDHCFPEAVGEPLSLKHVEEMAIYGTSETAPSLSQNQANNHEVQLLHVLVKLDNS